ncbi:unnamed protein product [Linum tenue]|uniref:Disease resistance protein RGA3 n=1 Tax=Linum tenue TaxID=586396 RepID=A0AAV0IFW3_9ROSI|nr:unnamed protein product [Linum tenue]
MAEVILFPIGKQILGKLSDFAVQEIGLLWTLKKELKKLEGTMSTIQAVLLDAEKKQKHNDQIKLWLSNLSEAMYDADDLLDDFATHEALTQQQQQQQNDMSCSCSSVVSYLASLSKRLLYGLKMAHDIKDIRERLDDISANRTQFNLEQVSPASDDDGDERETISSPPSCVVGREADKERLISVLLNDDDTHVLPIVGIGGMGKTTLAQLLFEDDRIKQNFEVRQWVYVSERFIVKNVVKKILESVSSEPIQGEDLQLNFLKDRLRQHIEGRRSLFILDDVWEENSQKWELLKKCLLVGVSKGSKVVLTTRLETVARTASITEPYRLGGISVDEAWDLIVHMVFNGQQPTSQSVVEIGKGIAKKCRGVPLAVNTIGNLLRRKHPETEWSFFLDNELSSIPEGENYVLSTLRLSYNYLPPHLKNCFAYCSLYPKGCEIDVPALVMMWIAQGFVGSVNKAVLSAEDMALQYFEKLWWGSFFQEVERDELGTITTCKMHDLMHDLAGLVAEDRIMKIDDLNGMVPAITTRTRHVSVTSCNENDGFQMQEEARQLRTLLLIRSKSNLLMKGQHEAIVHNLRRLRVLGPSPGEPQSEPISQGGLRTAMMVLKAAMTFMEASINVVELSDSIGELKHLRYLDISKNRVVEIPDSLTTLINLQLLNLTRCDKLERLPKGMETLVNLRHLYLDGCGELTYMPKGIGKLTALQTLTLFVVADPSKVDPDVAALLEELTVLNHLGGKLTIKGLEHLDSKSAADGWYLKEKKRLQSLKLIWRDPNQDGAVAVTWMERLRPHSNLRKLEIIGYRGMSFPSWASDISDKRYYYL